MLARLLLPAFCLIVSGQAATNPGAKIRVTQSGLNYAAAEAAKSLSAAIKRITIPNFDGKAHVVVGDVEYHATNIRVGKNLTRILYQGKLNGLDRSSL